MIKINLLPPEKRKKARRAAPAAKKETVAGPKRSFALPGGGSKIVLLPAAMAVLAVLFIAGSFFWLGYRENSLNKKRDELRVELNRLNQVILRMDELRERTRNVIGRMDVIVKIDQDRFIWPRTLDDISSSLPRYTWLQTISEVTPFPELTMRIEGHTMSNILLSELLANLEQQESLTDVKLISSAERPLGGYDTKYFVIQCASTFNQPADSTAQVAQAQ